MLATSPSHRGVAHAWDKPRAASHLRLSQGLALTASKGSLHSNESSAEWAKGVATSTISPRHKKARSPVERQQYEILHEVRKQRAAQRLQDIQVQRSQIIDGIRSRAADFGETHPDPSRSLAGTHRRKKVDSILSKDGLS